MGALGAMSHMASCASLHDCAGVRACVCVCVCVCVCACVWCMSSFDAHLWTHAQVWTVSDVCICTCVQNSVTHVHAYTYQSVRGVCVSVKRDLCMRQKRPLNTGIPLGMWCMMRIYGHMRRGMLVLRGLFCRIYRSLLTLTHTPRIIYGHMRRRGHFCTCCVCVCV